jgi:hypothetical protein
MVTALPHLNEAHAVSLESSCYRATRTIALTTTTLAPACGEFDPANTDDEGEDGGCTEDSDCDEPYCMGTVAPPTQEVLRHVKNIYRKRSIWTCVNVHQRWHITARLLVSLCRGRSLHMSSVSFMILYSLCIRSST